MVYDLVVVGNGVAAQTFLFELFSQLELDVKKSQNYFVAQISCEDIAPACSLRSTATVSLSGIEEGISELGDELSASYFAFLDFFNKYKPTGVEKVKQLITFSSVREKEKLLRRYKSLTPFNEDFLKNQNIGVELESFIISPQIYHQWFKEELKTKKISKYEMFLKKMQKNELGHYECELINGEKITTKKIVFCTGAYTKIFSQFFEETQAQSLTQVLSGAYLEKSIDLNINSFFLCVDGHNLIYRNSDKRLIMGSASKKGAFFVSEMEELKSILNLFGNFLKIDLGELNQYKRIVGLRHKAKKRKPIARALDENKSIYLISGFYKNGFSFSHLFAKKIISELFALATPKG